jgi:hypothetical protein
MARNTSPPPRQESRQASLKGSNPQAEAQSPEWDDDAPWDQDEAAAGHRARRLLSGSDSTLHRLTDQVAAAQRWVRGERWVKRLAVVVAALAVIFASCFGALWWRLGAGPINLDIATPWLAAAIEDNIGHGNTVEVGGTQIERAGKIRIAVRIRDIIVRDRDHAIVASAPKAEVRLSGTALLIGRLRAESLNLVDAELAVRITPEGYVTVSAGDTASRRNRRRVETRGQHGADIPRAVPVGAISDSSSAPAAPSGTGGAGQQQSGLSAGLDWPDS